MREIAEMTRHMVERAKQYEADTIPGDFGVLSTPCPKCGGQIRETYKKFQCGTCDYALWKIVAGRQYEPAEIEQLLTDRQVGPLTGFRNKMGRSFAAAIKLNDDLQPEFDFGQDKAEAAEAEPVDFSGQEASASARNARQGTSTATTTSAKNRSAPAKPATSAPARSSCSNPSTPPR
jgi:DNA topoisomerase-3